MDVYHGGTCKIWGQWHPWKRRNTEVEMEGWWSSWTHTQGSSTRNANNTRQAPEVQTMYSLNLPVSALRTKMRQEFERHRYVNQIKTVDVLLFNSHQEYQVRPDTTMPKRGSDLVSRKLSTSGSRHHTCSSTSAPRRSPRRSSPTTSSTVSSRAATDSLTC
jgi:hypothetical protein